MNLEDALGEGWPSAAPNTQAGPWPGQPADPTWPGQPAANPAWPGGPGGQPPANPAWPAGPGGQPSANPAWPGGPGGQPPANPAWPAGPGGQPPANPAWPAGPGGQPPANPSWPGGPGGQPPANPAWPGGPGGQPPANPAWPGGPGGQPPANPSWPGPGGPGPGPVPAVAPQQSLAVPYKQILPNGVYDKLLITIAGIVNPNAEKITVDMFAGQDLAFHFNPRFNEGGKKVIVRNSCIATKWGKEERDLQNFPFVQGQPFEMKILCTNKEFKVAVNNTHVLAFQHRVTNLKSINSLNIYCDLKLTNVNMETLP
ncbi:hypothetical protein PFLUV_G00238000 [Perca fluviatilis]|uniref:Galectin n=1 Tax=Perca fluviatilis TaxID=8168 RepID=A0A6A5EGY1_PERFL|nr:galectin-3b [Perca fluviatilis]XP_039642970.1 galectin-3b [Perca fluviatilis]KAF1375284.1 hypothetical protein PFLUV_G00238000 [Perca fluviatilis]